MEARFLLIPLIALQFAAQASEVEITSEPSHHLALQNKYVRVFKVEVAPNAATLMHRHRHDYLFVSLGAAHIASQVEGKPPVEMKLADGDTEFTRGNFAHIARDLSDQPFRNVTIELLQDKKVRRAPCPWPMEGGRNEFAGGHIKVLFVRDGARISEIDLQPGATIPSHRHDGPRLLVAVSDLSLRSDIPGKPPIACVLKSGDIKWLEGGYTHTLTNTAATPARYVTVEFATGTSAQNTSAPEGNASQKAIQMTGWRPLSR